MWKKEGGRSRQKKSLKRGGRTLESERREKKYKGSIRKDYRSFFALSKISDCAIDYVFDLQKVRKMEYNWSRNGGH
jgi:hypothetical protein